MPVTGAPTCVSAIASLAVCRFACAVTTAERAVAAPSCGGIVARLGDRLALVEGLAALELRGRVVELRLGDVEARLGLGQVALRDARVDPGQQLTLLHLVPRLDRHLEDLPRCLRFHAQREDRLDDAGRGRRDDDVVLLDGDRLVRRSGLRLAAGAGDQTRRREGGQETTLHGQITSTARSAPVAASARGDRRRSRFGSAGGIAVAPGRETRSAARAPSLFRSGRS